MEWASAYLALGGLVGFLSGMFGIGGGTVLVPVLLILFEVQQFPATHIMHLALGTSMATIVFTSLASMRKHHQYGAVNWAVVHTVTPGILLGTGLGALCATFVPTNGLKVFFALFLCCIAMQILFDLRPQASRQLPGVTGMTITGTLTGWISSLVSIGGGAIMVPFLVWCNVPIRNAIGTSAAIGFPVAAGGTMGYIATGLDTPGLPFPNLGFVHLPSLFWIALASVLCAPFGAKVAHHIQVNLLRKLFAIIMLVLATHLLL